MTVIRTFPAPPPSQGKDPGNEVGRPFASTFKIETQARRVDSVEGGSFMFWEVFFSAGGANTCAEGVRL